MSNYLEQAFRLTQVIDSLVDSNKNLSDKLKEREWRDISEAPKDGTVILALRGKQPVLCLYCKCAHVPFYGFHEYDRDADADSFSPEYYLPLPSIPRGDSK